MSSGGELRLALLLCGLAFALFYRIGDAPAANPAEARVEAVVQGMVDTGDWLVPRIDGQPRLHKPPGYYWLATALSNIAGEASWTSVRAGSALAALALVALTFSWGRALGGPTLGLLAALCLGSMQFTVAFGRRGVAEMMLAFSSTLALASFDRLRFEQRWTRLLPLGLGLLGAILAKATAGLLFAGLPIALQLSLDQRWQSDLGRRVAACAALACAAGFLWYAVVLVSVPGAGRVFASEALLPVGLQVEGTRSALHYALPTKYLGPLFGGLLPASLFLPIAIRRAFVSRAWKAAPRTRFVALAAGSLLAALALIPQKQRHYLVPLLPLFALLLAESILELRERAPERLRAALTWATAIASPAALAALVGLSCFFGDFLGVSEIRRTLLIGAGVALLTGLFWTAQQGRMRSFAGLAGAANLALMLGWFGSIGLWRSRFEAGTATRAPEYEATRWQHAAAEHPLIARFLRADADRS